MFSLIRLLFQTDRITFKGTYHLGVSFFRYRTNLIALLYFVSRLHKSKTAFTIGEQSYTYEEIWRKTQGVTQFLAQNYAISPTQKTAILCRNHPMMVQCLFGLAQLGADVFLLNPEMTKEQLDILQKKYGFEFLILEEALLHLIEKKEPSFAYITTEDIDKLDFATLNVHINTNKAGKIVILTGGTTGNAKIAKHKPAVFDFLPPFLALIKDLHLNKYKKVYIPLPLYHGFGLSSLLVSLLLGANIHLTPKFEAKQACKLIANTNIEVVTLVPIMLQRMLGHDPSALKGLKIILSGGAVLHEALVREALSTLGEKVANLYGTTEGGFCVLATPKDLRKYPNTIGRAIEGANLILYNNQNQPFGEVNKIGRLFVKNAWSVAHKDERGIETGDLAWKNEEGYYFLCGRVDDMIVSGGENVYPLDLENILLRHTDIQEAAVVGIPDAEFGQRLHVFVVLRNKELRKEDLFEWCRIHCARFQQPKYIDFLELLPTTQLGKVDKKKLSSC